MTAAPPGHAPTTTLTPRVQEGDAAKAAWLSRLARRATDGALSNRQASSLARRALSDRRDWTVEEFLAWLMQQAPGPKRGIPAQARAIRCPRGAVTAR